MKLRSVLGSLVFVAASILNPAYFAGCGASDDDDYQYGAKDMAALLETANGSHEIESEGRTYRVELNVAPEAESEARASWWSAKAFACGDRTLYATASACIDTSSMAVSGELKVVRIESDGERTLFDGAIKSPGRMRVAGLTLSNASLDIQFDGGSMYLSSDDGKRFGNVMLSVAP